MSVKVEIRTPRVGRIFIVAFGVLWCGFGLFIAVFLALSGTPFALVPLAMVAVGASLGFSYSRLRVLADSDQLVVRNYFRTHRVGGGRIKEFAIGKRGGVSAAPHSFSIGWEFVIEARLDDDTLVPLEATRWSRLVPWAGPTLNGQLADLQDWTDAIRADPQGTARDSSGLIAPDCATVPE